jgi:hypothetical protein
LTEVTFWLQGMHLLEMEIKHRCNQALEMGFGFYGLAKLFAQDWEGDVTIVMNASLAQVSRLPNDENKTLIDFPPFRAEEVMAIPKPRLCQVVFTQKRCMNELCWWVPQVRC